jgi:inosose dehydratase
MSRIAGAPISWGVCEAPDWGVQLEPDVVLQEIRRAGFDAIEAGPDGWLPTDPDPLRRTLEANSLQLAGAFLPVDLTSRAAFDATLPIFERVLERVAVGHDAVVNLALMGSDDEYAGRLKLDAEHWRASLDGLDKLAAIAAVRGLTCVLHPHAGTAVERREDLDRLLEGSNIGLCLDTGHLLLGGIDPVDVASDAGDRIHHVHLKDVDADVAERWRSDEFATMRAAVDAGVWRQLGDGDARVGEVIDQLVGAGYDRWYVLERDASLDEADIDDADLRVESAIEDREWVEARLAAAVTT